MDSGARGDTRPHRAHKRCKCIVGTATACEQTAVRVRIAGAVIYCIGIRRCTQRASKLKQT
eukprot:10248984-Alexandrium_andersonii.AAC.1